jgi:hypothetical protein
MWTASCVRLRTVSDQPISHASSVARDSPICAVNPSNEPLETDGGPPSTGARLDDLALRAHESVSLFRARTPCLMPNARNHPHELGVRNSPETTTRVNAAHGPPFVNFASHSVRCSPAAHRGHGSRDDPRSRLHWPRAGEARPCSRRQRVTRQSLPLHEERVAYSTSSRVG